MAMLPLACGIFWMVGLMYLSGIMLSIMTVIALPMIVGIGIDDGVHIMHRWRSEGNGNVKTVFASTGKAIFLTSLTTGFAFGSLVFSVFRGWAQFGAALAIGVGTCFLTTVIVLPGIIGFLNRNK
jgi:predicted RND superfamily exporter protein